MRARTACAIFLVVIGMSFIIVSITINSQPSPEIQEEPIEPVPGPVVYDVIGYWAPMYDLSIRKYNGATKTTPTMSGPVVFSYLIVPNADIPFSYPASSLVIVYQSERGFIFGWRISTGWWFMFANQASRDQVIIDYLLSESEAYL